MASLLPFPRASSSPGSLGTGEGPLRGLPDDVGMEGADCVGEGSPSFAAVLSLSSSEGWL